MALEVIYGFNNLTTQSRHSRYQAAAQVLNYKHGVADGGLVVTPTAVPRQVSVSPSSQIVTAGLLSQSTEPVLITLDAGGSAARTDFIAFEADWSQWANPTSAATIKSFKGTSTTGPTSDMTQVDGELWRMPVARISVPANHTGVFTTSQITKCVPLPGPGRRYRSAVDADTIARTSNGQNCAVIDVIDPGRPYYLDLRGQLRVSGDDGYARVSLTVDTVTHAVNYSGLMTPTNGSQPVSVGIVTALLYGPVRVAMHVAPEVMTSGNLGWGGGSNNHLSAFQLYA